MTNTATFLLLLFLAMACTEKKQENKEPMMPVEQDNGIGDGAPSLDSVLKENDPKTNPILKDSI